MLCAAGGLIESEGVMIKGSEIRKPDHEVEQILVDRWSPRAMSGDDISNDELQSLFEAARWAPSSMNNQPWRMLYATRGSSHWTAFFDLLVDANKVWCAKASVLVVMVSKTTLDNGKPCRTHSYDTGAAWMSLALQGAAMGLVVHGMQGFDYDRARVDLQIPDGYQVEAMAAVGRPGAVEELPEPLQAREIPSDRRALVLSVCEGPFSL
jgi:nitroreductase